MAEIKLTRSGIQVTNDEYQSYILDITASDPVDMPAEIFVYQKDRIILNGNAVDDPAYDVFVSVADPTDLQEYPVTRPPHDDDQVYYRQATCQLLFRCVEDMEDTWQAIQEDVRGLVRAITSYSNLQPLEEVIING